MKNRYDALLRKYNQAILELCPYNPNLFIESAKIIDSLYREDMRVLEIGSGEGNSALPILERTSVTLDLLDVSPEMNALAEKKLAKFADRTHFVCADAYDYIKESEPYDIIYSAWTIHNFNQADKGRLFEMIYKGLKPNGVFMLLDKVYPSESHESLLEHQNNRYRNFLVPEAAEAIIEHEYEDYSDEYRMEEPVLLDYLKQIGFSKIDLVDRIERDIVLVATK